MPEGDSVAHAARRIHGALAGERLVRAELRVPRFAAVDLSGRDVLGARARGKHLFIDMGVVDSGFIDIDTAGLAPDPIVVHLHLKMEGKIHIHPRGTRWRFPAHTARLILASSSTELIGTELGFVRVLTPGEAERAVSHLGPDLLGSSFDAREAVRRIRSAPERQIGLALLDQRNLAGIGTIYRSETCFLRGVDPRTPVGGVDRLGDMVDLARRLLAANVGRRRVTTGDPRRGRELWVYGREGLPCFRCGTPIERFQMGGPEDDSLERICFICTTCQPALVPHSKHSSSAP